MLYQVALSQKFKPFHPYLKSYFYPHRKRHGFKRHKLRPPRLYFQFPFSKFDRPIAWGQWLAWAPRIWPTTHVNPICHIQKVLFNAWYTKLSYRVPEAPSLSPSLWKTRRSTYVISKRYGFEIISSHLGKNGEFQIRPLIKQKDGQRKILFIGLWKYYIFWLLLNLQWSIENRKACNFYMIGCTKFFIVESDPHSKGKNSLKFLTLVFLNPWLLNTLKIEYCSILILQLGSEHSVIAAKRQ